MKIAIGFVNQKGKKIASHLKKDFIDSKIYSVNKANIEKIFKEHQGIIIIAAMGIVVRFISPLIKNKYIDPAVVCVDTEARYAISVLSGHEGGANDLTYLAAKSIGAEPIITTGTESSKKIIVGIGCRKGALKESIVEAIEVNLKKKKIKLKDVKCVASIDIKKNETGLIEACTHLNLGFRFFSKEEINRLKVNLNESEKAKKHLGVQGVCEPCALLAGRNTKLILPKTVTNQVTISIAKEA